jgi:hypothetical protein
LRVGEFVQAELLERLVFPSNITDSVAGSVGAFNCLAQQLRLLFGRIQFDLRYQFHNPIIARLFHYGKNFFQRKEQETGIYNQACGIDPLRLMPNSSPA